ncbi:Phosphatidylinositolglycan class N-domain-containing protein [Geopyxis carbonaria]|nr:Phosphatidylinositolglycan class N-domain-containing protein [Geopyxis carbonaria]
MARLGRLGFLAIGVVFHIVYLYTIFDIYFVSPIVHGMRPHRVHALAPAKRLFLLVGDGLRADKCFQQHPDVDDPINPAQPRYLAPFVRSKVLTEGTFGVSHTRVPTESRPGHVALIAGLYEDVSAVTTGWKLNPVNFDSVFNQSRHTWSWGSPDILPMFKEGASDPARVDAYTYGEEMEDFTQDPTNLDRWVFEHVEEFFDEAKRNPALNAMLREDKLVFFLHLLGLDTSGHAFRPYSPEYLRNIKVVDAGIEKLNALVDDFYGHDGQTAWVFTADHGMSDWGSHGDGHPDNTRTPLVAWGAGVKQPVRADADEIMPGHEDGFSADWGLDSVKRNDVAQADVAALMAYLVGLNFPVNSVGELPLDFIDADPNTQAAAVWANTRQILEMYRVKEELKKSTTLNYKPYEPLKELDRKFSEIETLLRMNAHHMAIEKSTSLLTHGLAGLRYLQTYDWLFLRTLVTLGYLGWIAFALTHVLDEHVLHRSTSAQRSPLSTVFFAGVLSSLYTLFYVQHARLTYYPYALFPVLFWEEVFVRRATVIKGLGTMASEATGGKAVLALQAVAGVALMEAVVLGYFHREVFTACFLLAATWPLWYGKSFVKQNKTLAAVWAATCAVMSVFTLLPAMKAESEWQIILGGLLMLATGLAYMYHGDGASARDRTAQLVLGVQTGLIALSLIVTVSSLRSLRAKAGLPLGNQVVGWLTLLSSLIIPGCYSLSTRHIPKSPLSTLVRLFLTFAPTFILLTISYESLFFTSFTLLLHLWTTLEARLSPPGSRLQLSDLRVALFFFFLLQSAFFSTGNIASISSFSLDSVYRLIPIFDPFAMGALLLFKLLIPFVLISAVLGGVARREGVFGAASAVSDVLTLNFFWMVRDEGSWLEIGSSISHFFIGGLLGGAVMGSVEEVVGEEKVEKVEERGKLRAPGSAKKSGGQRSRSKRRR